MVKYLTQREVRERYGRSDMSLYRWQRDRGFPRPYKFAGQNYYAADELDRFDSAHRRSTVKQVSSCFA